MDGLEICRRLRADQRTVTLPIIVLTAHTSTSDMVAALDAGADDFVTKPFQQVELLARLRSSCRTREVIRRMEQAHDIVVALANAVEAKDLGLKDHCRYLAYRSARLAAYVGLRDGELEGVAYGALLHDIGKIGIAEHVLHKPGPLTDDEFRIMREHPEIGERICDPLRMSRDFTPIIRHHHERWDGSGYPDGLKGEAIPLGARIVALADAFDAIVRGRPYRPARSVGRGLRRAPQARRQAVRPGPRAALHRGGRPARLGRRAQRGAAARGAAGRDAPIVTRAGSLRV